MEIYGVTGICAIRDMSFVCLFVLRTISVKTNETFARFAFAGFHFLWGSLVVIKAILVFKLFINFDRSVNPEVWSRSLQIFWICRVCSHRQVKFRIEFHWLLKTTKSKFFVNESVCDWLKNLGWPRLKIFFVLDVPVHKGFFFCTMWPLLHTHATYSHVTHRGSEQYTWNATGKNGFSIQKSRWKANSNSSLFYLQIGQSKRV